MKKVALLLTIFALAGLYMYAQTGGQGRVVGYVYDEQGNPIEGVKVKLYSIMGQAGMEKVTDKDGKWVAARITGGAWNVDFEKAGYEPKKISMQVSQLKRNPVVEVNLKKIETGGMTITEELEKKLDTGNELFNAGEYDQAMAVYEEMLADFPDAYIINMNIGNCYFQKEDYDKAEEYYKKIIEQDAENAKALLAIGNCYTNRGDDEKALEWYNKIEMDKIEDNIVLYNIGVGFKNSGQHEDALKYFKRSVEVDENFLDGLYQLGLSYTSMMQKKEAIAIFEKYLSIDPDSDRATQVRGFLDYLKR